MDAVLAAIRTTKGRRGIPGDARIHCREIFAGDRRRKSAFRILNPNEVHELISECVEAVSGSGATWWGAWVDRQRYPLQLQLGQQERPFDVTAKHLAGLACFSALVNLEHNVGPEYRLAFDPDPTKIDWGLARRMQATHFARTHSNAVPLPDEQQPLLEMADIGAYAVAQSFLADLEPGNRKAKRVAPLLKLMRMSIGRFAYAPPEEPAGAESPATI
jgi:hypothetical protein